MESDGKTATLTATYGGSVTVEDAQDTIPFHDFAAFRTYLVPQQQVGRPNRMLDLGTRFVRVGPIGSEGPAPATTLDYGAYHIDLHVVNEGAYLPLVCEPDLLAVASCAALFYNGTNLYLTDNGRTMLADPALTQSQAFLESGLAKDGSVYEELTKTDLVSSFLENRIW